MRSPHFSKVFFLFALFYGGGGGGRIIDSTLYFCGIRIRKTSNYKRLLSSFILYQNPWFEKSISTLEHQNILERIQRLTRGLDSESINCVYRIISRTLKVERSPIKAISLLTRQEIQALILLHQEFYPNISCISQNIFHYNGYLLPKRHGAEIFWHRHGIDTLKNLEALKDKDIIDVGGYIGDSALILQEYTNKHIHSFETTSSNYALMLQTIKLNNAKRIIPINKGLGSSHTAMNIVVADGSSSLVVSSNDKLQEKVEIITLDSYVAEHNVKVGFIKVDIEGFEMEFLQGAKETICTQKPAMLISIYHDIEHFFEIKPLLESWDLGYKFHIHKPIDENISVETGLFCEVL